MINYLNTDEQNHYAIHGQLHQMFYGELHLAIYK